MSLLYGNKFSDMWDGIDKHEVKQCWADELSQFSIQQISEGVNALSRAAWPPTLPEFIGMCGASKPPTTAQIPYKCNFGKYNPNDPEIVAARERCMATAARLGMRGFVEKMTAAEII